MRAGHNGDGSRSGLLTGWQAIATHFGRNQSTVRRWAANAELPVHRGAGDKGVAVYAYVDELDAWLTRRRAEYDAGETGTEADGLAEEAAPPAAAPSRRHVVAWGASVAALALLAGGGAVIWTLQGRIAPPGAHAADTVPEEARELYLRGTYLWNRRTPEGIAGAIDALTRAVEIYPAYAEAHAGLAMTFNLARQYSGMSGWEAYPKAESAARRAVELDPTLDLAQGALAFVEFHWHWRVEAGLTRFAEAIRLNPNSANNHMWYASALLLAGRPQEALPIANRAQQLDPHNSAVLNIKAQALFYGGDIEAARDLLADMIAQDPGFAWAYYTRSFIHLSQADYEGYLADYGRLGDLIAVPRYRAAAEAGMSALVESGPEAMAMAMFSVEQEFYERGEALAWDLARHHALIGDGDKALRWLRVSLNRREERLIGIKVDPAFWPIRGYPGYTELLAEIGFPADG